MEKKIRGGLSSVMGDGYVKSDETKKILYIDATKLYGHSTSQVLPYDGIEMWHDHPGLYLNKLEEILITPDDSDIGYFNEVDLKNPHITKEKTNIFPFYPGNKIIPKDQYNDYMKKIKPKNFTRAEKVICDWTDKKNYLVHYRMFVVYVGHGMIVDEVFEMISIKQSKLFEKYLNFTTQKNAKNKFEMDLYNLPKNVFYGQTMENVRNHS